MNHWWRAYNEAVNDPKLQLLSDALFRAWFNLMCIASSNDGKLPPVKDVAFTLRIKPERAAQILTQLHGAGLLDKTETGFVPHNWNGRQYKSDVSNDRVKRFRERKRNVTSAVTVTPPETDTEAETDQNRKESDWPEDFRDQFWEAYPHKIGKSAALQKLFDVQGTVDWPQLMAGLDRYKQSKPADRPWCNPWRWLSEGRWDDQPADKGVVSSSDQMNLEDAVRLYARSRVWSKYAPGGEPGMSNCQASSELLAKHGLMPDGRPMTSH